MPYYTPLRYPGGKRRLAPTVVQLLAENELTDAHYVEPFAGGAAVALALLLEEHAAVVHINDLSRPVYAFWHSVLNEPDELCRRIERTTVSVRQWQLQRGVYARRESEDLVDLGFATFFLNRVNRSGILGGGVIGGKNQTGAWGIDARFNRTDLVQRIRRISRYQGRIRLYQSDALKFIDEVMPRLGRNAFFFFDPPYIENGEDLYLNEYHLDDHKRLAERIQKIDRPWIVTYDYAAVREGLYAGHRHVVYKLPYSAQGRYQGREAMFLSNGLRVPSSWRGERRIAMAGPHSPHPLSGRMERSRPRKKAKALRMTRGGIH